MAHRPDLAISVSNYSRRYSTTPCANVLLDEVVLNFFKSPALWAGLFTKANVEAPPFGRGGNVQPVAAAGPGCDRMCACRLNERTIRVMRRNGSWSGLRHRGCELFERIFDDVLCRCLATGSCFKFLQKPRPLGGVIYFSWQILVIGSGLLYCLIRNEWQEPFWGIHGASKSIEDLEFKPPISIGMRPPSGGILERSMPVCDGAKGTCPSRINIFKHLRRPDPIT